MRRRNESDSRSSSFLAGSDISTDQEVTVAVFLNHFAQRMSLVILVLLREKDISLVLCECASRRRGVGAGLPRSNRALVMS